VQTQHFGTWLHEGGGIGEEGAVGAVGAVSAVDDARDPGN